MPLFSLADISTVLGTVLGALTVAGSAFEVGRRFGRRRARQEFAENRDLKRLNEIYAPIIGMFTECHITTSTGRGAPYLRQRLRNARDEFKDGRFKQSVRAVFDKQDLGTSGEVEYGNSFPLTRIIAHLRGREQYSDPELLYSVKRAARSHYEDDAAERELTEAELKLLNFVYQEYARLSERFAGA